MAFGMGYNDRGVFYVNAVNSEGEDLNHLCSGYDEATEKYLEVIKDKKYLHVEITKQLRVYLPETDEEFID